VSQGAFAKVLGLIARIFGLPALRVHDLRHGFAFRLAISFRRNAAHGVGSLPRTLEAAGPRRGSKLPKRPVREAAERVALASGRHRLQVLLPKTLSGTSPMVATFLGATTIGSPSLPAEHAERLDASPEVGAYGLRTPRGAAPAVSRLDAKGRIYLDVLSARAARLASKEYVSRRQRLSGFALRVQTVRRAKSWVLRSQVDSKAKRVTSANAT